MPYKAQFTFWQSDDLIAEVFDNVQCFALKAITGYEGGQASGDWRDIIS